MSASPPMPPMPPMTYPYQAAPSVPRGGSVPVARKQGPSGFMTTLIIIIVCALVGGGIYYFINQQEEPLPPNGTIDITSLNIQNVSSSSVTETGATITWDTDEPATGKVEYGTSKAYDSTAPLDTNLSNSHSVTLTDLDPGTKYYFKITSENAAGNKATAEGNLTTVAEADETPPTISGVSVSNITESSATITWLTNEDATSQVEYGKTETYGSSTTLDTNLTESHNVTLNGLSDNTTYYFKVISKDASDNEATLAEADQTFDTEYVIPEGYEEGNLAPDFSLEDINDKEWKLSDFRGKIVMVNFWFTTCGPCNEEMPYLQGIQASDDWSDVKIFAINYKETGQTVRAFIQNNPQYQFTILLDPDGTINERYNVDVSHWPTTFFIDAEGVIQKIQKGNFESQDQIEDILRTLQP
jgi:peroxiredoxin